MLVPQQFAIFPIINASLNGTSTILLLTGRWLITQKRIAAHRLVMLAALTTSTLFLVSYVYYHAHVGSVHFQGTGWRRPVYFSILISHVALAAVIVPLITITLARALRERFDRHRAIARWTFPLWLYVSVTGVLVYFMLYHWFAAPTPRQDSTGLCEFPGVQAQARRILTMATVRLKIDVSATVGDEAWMGLHPFGQIQKAAFGPQFGSSGPCKHPAAEPHGKGEWIGAEITLPTPLLAQYAVSHYLEQERVLDADVVE